MVLILIGKAIICSIFHKKFKEVRGNRYRCSRCGWGLDWLNHEPGQT